MKKVSIVLSAIAVVCLLSFKMVTTVDDHRMAKVKINTPYLIFYQCEPTADYTVMGEIAGARLGKDLHTAWLTLTNKCQEQFPRADALIIDDNFTSAQAIQFK